MHRSDYKNFFPKQKSALHFGTGDDVLRAYTRACDIVGVCPTKIVCGHHKYGVGAYKQWYMIQWIVIVENLEHAFEKPDMAKDWLHRKNPLLPFNGLSPMQLIREDPRKLAEIRIYTDGLFCEYYKNNTSKYLTFDF